MLKQILELLRTNKDFYNRIREDFTYHSSVIEGSTITKEQHQQLSKLSNTQSLNKIINQLHINKEDAIENFNCLKLFDYVFNHLENKLIHHEICQYQAILKENTAFQSNNPNEVGSYRKSSVMVGRHHPPESYKIHELMEQLITNFNYRKLLLIDDIAEFHAQFESIHPFRDGNGRVGRIIAFKQCLNNNVIPFIVNKETRSTYINCLEIYNLKTDALTLAKYFLDQQKVFADIYRQYLNENKSIYLSDNENKVIAYLKKNEFANRAEIQEYANLKIATAKRILSKLVKNKFIKVIGGSKNSKYTLL
jgi:Fic family protein